MFKTTETNGDQRVHAVVGQLAKLVRSRFGGTLEYHTLSANSAEHAILRDQLLSNSPIQRDDKWVFAVLRQYQIVGFAQIGGVGEMNSDQQAQLSELIELYLDATLALSDRASSLIRQSEDLERAINERNEAKIIPLHRPRPAPPTTYLQPRKLRFGFALPCMIEGLNHTDIKKLALELHELSGRQAFVYMSDLNWNSPEELLELGTLTLFVPDLANLSHEEQRRLLAYLELAPGLDHPQVVVGCLQSPAKFRDEKLFLQPLIEKLDVCFLKMTRPFEDYLREGIVDFFFSGLVHDGPSGRPN